MKQETEREIIVKIRTKKGRIITLTISSQDETRLVGYDKFGKPVIIPLEEIDSMLPLTNEGK